MNTKTRYNPDKHHRRSIRLCGYDYAQEGLYFVTVCCRDKACLFGEIVDGEMILNPAGRMVEKCWLDIPKHFPHVVLHDYIIMPNHVHGIIELTDVVAGATNVRAKNFSPLPRQSQFRSPSKTIGSIVRGFKIPFGNAIITNISSAMPNRTKTLQNTSLRTLPVGRTIIFIYASIPKRMNRNGKR